MTKKSFHLRWNNHLQNLQSLFENLYNEQSLVDVTIGCSDGLLYGHKLVLSACSPYFEQVFKDNPCKHPIMILKGIRRCDMQVLLQYMYVGSVDVGEDDLEMLLDIATELQIKGLVQCSEETPHSLYQRTNLDRIYQFSKDSTNISTPSTIPQNISELRWQAELSGTTSGSKHRECDSVNKNLATVNSSRQSSKDENVLLNGQMMLQHHEQKENQEKLENLYLNHTVGGEKPIIKEEIQETSEEESKDYNPVESVEESSENMQIGYKFSDSDGVNYFCHVCTRSFQNKGSYHRHMMTHAGVKPHHCTFCNQSFLRLSHLQRHIRVHTGERPYSCGQCPKQFARSDKLRQHYIIQHNDTNGTKTSKPRGRPRKNLDLYPPIISATNISNLNLHPVNINTPSLNAV